jgi:hypothetical protein
MLLSRPSVFSFPAQCTFRNNNPFTATSPAATAPLKPSPKPRVSARKSYSSNGESVPPPPKPFLSDIKPKTVEKVNKTAEISL